MKNHHQHHIGVLLVKSFSPFCLLRKKLTQLQHAYTCLFRDYDSKLKSEVRHI